MNGPWVARLACADFAFPLLPHEQALDLISMLGLEGADIGLFQDRGHVQPSAELKAPGRAAGRLRKKLADRDLALADVFLIPARNFADLAPNHPEAGVRRRGREQYRRLLEYTRESGGRHLTALPGIHFPGEPETASWERAKEELAWRAAGAAEGGLVYAVEPHLGSIIATPAKALRFVREVPGLTYTLDYGHFKRGGFADAKVEALVAHSSHFHCRGGTRSRLQASFRANTIDFARAARAMQKAGYSGYIALEYVWMDWEHCNEVDNLSETILYRDFWRGLR